MKLSTTILAAIFLFAAPQGADAQAACAPFDKIKEGLSKRYGEEQKAIAMESSGKLLHVWVSKKGTWTITLTSPNKIACILAVGDEWQERAILLGLKH